MKKYCHKLPKHQKLLISLTLRNNVVFDLFWDKYDWKCLRLNESLWKCTRLELCVSFSVGLNSTWLVFFKTVDNTKYYA